MQEVKTIRKRKTYGLPNAIEIEWGTAPAHHTDLFTSFLNRREAYSLLVSTWGSCWYPHLLQRVCAGTHIFCSVLVR